MRKPVFVYEYQRTAQIFADMKTSSVTMCIVLDEYGVTAGVITMEDLIEEIVGDIRDEYDESENELIKEISPGHYDVEGGVKLDDLNDAIGTCLESENYDSIGGLMIELLDRLPKEGDMVRTGEVTLKCGKVERNRALRVDIVKTM
jgi:CBS domain containing-hemolysin-like protein